MPILSADCPRCHVTQSSFEVLADTEVSPPDARYKCWEAFCKCKLCRKSTVFVLRAERDSTAELLLHRHESPLYLPDPITDAVVIGGYIGTKDQVSDRIPDALPGDVELAYREAITCMAVGCNNAAGSMFRLCLDIATKSVVANLADTPNEKKIKFLKPRIKYLLDEGFLPRGLEELLDCVREDGTDAAHDGSLTEGEVRDLCDFSVSILERIYTEPARIEASKARREKRRNPSPAK